ncbi:MAG: DUF4432 family protein [Bacillales bacterium]|nr:DUF4432 family protein [Bacillales bacterium]
MEEYLGNPFQLYGVETYVLNHSRASGTEIMHAKNGLGLELYINVDRGFDITMVSLHGVTLSYLAPNGYVNSKYYDDKGNGFLKSFSAGFLTTCGLTQVGSPNVDEGEELPLHGTYSNIPCSNAYYQIEEGQIVLFGEISDETIFSHKLVLRRKIILSRLRNEFIIEDEIINRGDQDTPLEILYHMNLGYPLLDENLILKLPEGLVTPRNEHAKENIKSRLKMQKPEKGYEECCYYYDYFEDNISISAYNSKIKKGIIISYNKSNLPCFTEWKMMGIRDYVLGLEPGNCYPDGRNIMREKKILQFIKPNEVVKNKITIVCIEGDYK